MATPNELLEWALERLDPNGDNPPYPDALLGEDPDTEAYELVKERLTQAELDVEFYRKHYEGDPPLDSCACDDCMAFRSPEEQRKVLRSIWGEREVSRE